MSKINELTVSSGVLLFAIFFSGGAGNSQSEAGYVGWKSCTACHKEITQSWKKTPHAKAFESLCRTSQESLPGCVSCHVTAHEEPGGYIDFELTPELVNVQCEECHGPAESHIGKTAGRTDRIAIPGENKCRKCHTSGQDPKFNYDKKIIKIHPY